MKLDEVKDPVKQIGARAGVYPVYTNEEGKIFVHMMIPSNPKFGGALPQMGKGGIDDGESAEEAAMREGYEELGLLANNVARITQLTAGIIRSKKEQYHLTVFVAELKDPDNFDPAGWESKWAGWVDLDEAIKVSRKNQQQFLRLLQSKYSGNSLNEAIDVDAINKEIKKLENQIERIHIEVPANDPTMHNKLKREYKAKISFLKSQIELSQEHDIEPAPATRQAAIHLTPAKNLVDYQDSLRPFMETVKQHSQPYLKAIDNNVMQYRMFRGIRGTDATTMTGRVRLSGRKPMATGDETHDYINRYFQNRYGEEFRNAMFVSGNADFAKDYGNLFLVFPREEFTFLWSPKVKDMYDFEENMDWELYGKSGDLNYDKGDFKSLVKLLDTLKYQNTDMKAALKSKKEVMVRTQAYYGINLTEFFDRDDYDDDSRGDQNEINTAIKLIQGLLDEN